MKGTIKVIVDVCKGCGLCIPYCPSDLLKISDLINKFGYKALALDDPDGECTGCSLCAIMCPDLAIEVFREKKTSAA